MPTPKRVLKPIPTFSTEAAERTFWATADSTEYVDWSQAQAVRFPNLRPSSADRVAVERQRKRQRAEA